MSALLLDTHVFVWWATGSVHRPRGVVEVVRSAPQVQVSLVSLWEIVVKEGTRHPIIGAPDAAGWFAEAMEHTPIALLPIEFRHIARVQALPPHHGDSFDRLLVAQAVSEHLTIVTADPTLDAYPAPTAWPN